MANNNPPAREITRTVLVVLFMGLLLAASLWVLRPFLEPLIWATLIVVTTWPILTRLQSWLWGRRRAAVAVMTVMLSVILFLPFLLAIVTTLRQREKIISEVQALTSLEVPPVPSWLGDVPLVGPSWAERWGELAALTPEELSAKAMPLVRKAISWVLAQAGSVGKMVLHSLLIVVITAFLFIKGEVAAGGLLRFARRMGGQGGEDVAVLAGRAVQAVAMGVILTAMVQAALAGLGLVIAGVPAALVLTALILVLALAQLGPGPVMIPAVIWLFWRGEPLWGTILLIWSLAVIPLDSFLRPVLIRKRVDLPMVLILVGVIGGLLAFGIAGLFLGPVVLAVTYTLTKAWVQGGQAPEAVQGEEGVSGLE